MGGLMRLQAIVASLALALLCGLSSAGDWPQWRGPRGDGSSDDSHVPIRWSEKENIHWKTPIPGKGHSSPVVWGDRVFITTCLEREEQRMLLCLDRRDGRILWQ